MPLRLRAREIVPWRTPRILREISRARAFWDGRFLKIADERQHE